MKLAHLQNSLSYFIIILFVSTGVVDAQIFERFEGNILMYRSERLCHVDKGRITECNNGLGALQKVRFAKGYFFSSGIFAHGNPMFPLGKEESLLQNPLFRVDAGEVAKGYRYKEMTTSASIDGPSLTLKLKSTLMSPDSNPPSGKRLVSTDIRITKITFSENSCLSNEIVQYDSYYLFQDGHIKEAPSSIMVLDGHCAFVPKGD